MKVTLLLLAVSAIFLNNVYITSCAKIKNNNSTSVTAAPGNVVNARNKTPSGRKTRNEITNSTIPTSTITTTAINLFTSTSTSPPPTQQSTTPKKPTKKVTSLNLAVKSANKDAGLICPKEGRAEFQWFPLPCNNNKGCLYMGKNYRCCKQNGYKRCVKGVAKPLMEQTHEPILGLPRKCPKETLAETFWELQTCETDQDCWPRVCCPDGRQKYCRIATPEFQSAPFPAVRRLSYPLEAISGYIQCTPPPPASFDPYPKACNNTLDCFPNVCCQEEGKKHCRPPKRSLLALVATMTQRFSTGWIRDWAENLVIR